MKKLIIISLVIFFAICSKSWAEDLPNCPGSPAEWGKELPKWDNCMGKRYYKKAQNRRLSAEYFGEWKNDRYHGFGIYTYYNGDRYIGNFKNGNRHGEGKLQRIDGTYYLGEFKADKKHGQGKEKLKDGRILQGIFIEDKFSFLESKVENFSEGQKKCEKSPTSSVLTIKSWHKCKGEYVYTILEEGTITYSGEWKNGQQNGYGISEYKGSLGYTSYEGYWKNNERHGDGYQLYQDGSSYKGDFKNGKQHGKGKLITKSGIIYEGYFNSDRFTGINKDLIKCKNSPSSSKTVIDLWNGCMGVKFSGGKAYEGYFLGGKFHKGTTWFSISDYNNYVEHKNTNKDSNNKVTKRQEDNNQEKNNNSVKESINPNEIINAASGSGFIVSSSGHIVTNNHVINGCNEVKVHYSGEQYKASIISKDSYNDLALIKANFTPSTIFTIKNGNAELMEDIYVAGYPFGDLFNSSVKITKGIVSSLSGFENNFSNMQIDAALQPGNSGGPVIDYQGNVVGVAVAKLDLIKFVELFNSVPENTNFAIKSSVLLNFLNSNGLKIKKASEQIMPRSELSEKITKGTLFLSCWMTYARIEEMKTQKVLFNNIIK
tara:strand:+ start:38 stop:1837 length:1800 start_codon:yes stop_codon:yes gene_type:complete